MDDERVSSLEDSGAREAIPAPPAALVLEEGAILAQKYRLLRPAGFGGMAQLWVAVNEATGADVCVKVLVPEKSDDESVERFRREAHAAARLSHRAIVRIFDLVELAPNGETCANGKKPAALAIVMELLHGETLADLLMKRGMLGVEETIDLALPLLSALAHAHRAGVVHRDLKPDNVFLSTDPDGHVIPKVLDFGVSKLASDARSAALRSAQPVTLDGVMLGTPSFMSPEQARGSRAIDARSDVFSAGILMYVMLSGKNPFESEQFHSVVSAILHLDPPRIEGVPDALWEVIAGALAKDVEVRYRDATELGIALRGASGRTSTTESGPQSGIGISVPPGLLREPERRVLAAPLGGDSIVTVPPASNVEPRESVHAPLAARRRRATTVVIGLVVGSALLLLVAALRSAPRPHEAPPLAASALPSSSALAPPAESQPEAGLAMATAPASDAGAPRSPPPPRAPAKKNDRATAKERSIVRDPGF